MAETTPGPLILVVQFVGFLGRVPRPGRARRRWSPACSARCSTTWVTFVPCFLWIFLGAPYIERLRGEPQRSAAALSAITAAVVGVILNLAVWFALHLLFPGLVPATPFPGLHLLVPIWSTLQVPALFLPRRLPRPVPTALGHAPDPRSERRRGSPVPPARSLGSWHSLLPKPTIQAHERT